jgi:C-terminal processing protease CtpA/Prc
MLCSDLLFIGWRCGSFFFYRIERVEPGLAADLAGMRVADYIVFVGSHNVVKMDEEQVLQLIQ